MIKLTKMNGDDVYINPDLIEKIDSIPDTILTMNSQIQYHVKQAAAEVNQLIIEDKRKIFTSL